MHGLAEIREMNERATDNDWLRGRIQEALAMLGDWECGDAHCEICEARKLLREAMEGRSDDDMA